MFTPRTQASGLALLGGAALVALLLPGCKRDTRADEPAMARADEAATRFATSLRARLQDAMKQGGPTSAVTVCSTEARPLAEKITAETGVRVGRGSLRLRSSANAPPPWVAEWLRAQGERPAAGVVGVREVKGEVAHVLRPIAVEPVCVTCHGDPASLAPPLRDALRAAYPDDRATGYKVGDLRGALWAEVSR